MSKKKKRSKMNYSNNNVNSTSHYEYKSSFHGPAEHKLVSLYQGAIQATSGDNLRRNFKEYDLCLFLTDMKLPEDLPFCLGLPGPNVKTKIIIYLIQDGKAPDDGPYFDWLMKTLREELIKGSKIGIACIGGHGRTGTIIATLWGKASAEENNGVPKENPILAIREIIGCKKPVESKEQETFVYAQTGFPAPDAPVYSYFYKSSFSSGSSSGSANDFDFWDKSGKGVRAISFEPDLDANIVFFEFAKDVPFIVTPAWSIPLKRTANGEVPGVGKRIPETLCRVCWCAKGYATPAHKGSHLTCVVCPILAEMGISSVKPRSIIEVTAKVVPTTGQDPEGRCDWCGLLLPEGGKGGLLSFIDNEKYQFCEMACKAEYYNRFNLDPKDAITFADETPGEPEKKPFMQKTLFICDAKVKGGDGYYRTCNKKESNIVKVINGVRYHFCKWEHLSLMEVYLSRGVTSQKATPKGLLNAAPSEVVEGVNQPLAPDTTEKVHPSTMIDRLVDVFRAKRIDKEGVN